jgi:murein DD-endopeptidase MepM/ murein hydrolase activator NlpD
MAGLKRRWLPASAVLLRLAPLLATLALAGLGLATEGCASSPEPSSAQAGRRGGTVHLVRPGDNLYRIGKRYGVPSEVIQEANDIRDVTSLQVGQRLWIPPAGSSASQRATAQLAGRVRTAARSESGVRFRWPLRGKLTSRYGSRRGRHEGIDIAAPRGTAVVAAEAGRVIFAGRMGDYGKVVVVKHSGRYRSVYAHVRRFHVKKGHFVERGDRIAEVGTSGNASGPHLHFEIRERDRPRDPMLYLP